MHRNFLNKAVIVLSILLACILYYFYSFRTHYMHGDALGYYMYLPATFIYHNNKHLENLPGNTGIYPDVLNSVKSLSEQKTPMGYTQLQYTYGIALMESPFFFITHCYEKMSGKQANGYSASYNYMLIIASLAYAVLGLIIVYKILRNYFTDTQSLFGTMLTFWGTNMLWFSLFQGGMAHVPLFFLYALLIYLTIKIHRQPRSYLFPGIGFISGLITIIRPTDVLCVIIPLFYNVYNKETLRQKLFFIRAYKFQIISLFAAFVVPIIPQLLYWKEVAGSYFFYSYGQQSFNWGHPKIIEGLFYFGNGWLPYSPVMIFALAGLFFYRRIKEWFWCLWLILPLYIYVIYSWYCYNYINGLGSRPMIHMYPLLAIPLTVFISYVAKQKWLIKSAFGILCVFFVAMNICYSMQKSKLILNSEQSNIEFNFQMLFRMHLTYNDLVTYDIAERQPDANKITKTGVLSCNNFEDSLSAQYIKDTIFGGKYLYHMGTEEYSPGVKMTYHEKEFKGAKWIKCSGDFLYTNAPDYWKHMLVISSGNKFWKACKIENKVGDWVNKSDKDLEHYELNKWGYVYYYVRMPENLKDGDEISLFAWNTGKRELYMSHLCLELYK